MKTLTKFIIITFLIGALAFILGPVIWPSQPEGMEPTSGKLTLLTAFAALESLLFGFGIALLVVGRAWILENDPSERNMTVFTFAALLWLLVSRWPYSNLHRVAADDIQKLFFIDYGFHLTTIIAALVLVYDFIRYMRMRSEVSAQSR